MKKSINNINSVLLRTIRRFSSPETYNKYLILVNWKLAVGEHISSVTAIQKIDNGILFVACKSAPWCSEIETVYKEEIIKRLNERAGKEVVKDIRCSSRGFYRLKRSVPKKEEETEVKNIDSIFISDNEVKSAEKIAASAGNEKLKEIIQRAMINNKKLQSVKKMDGWKKCELCGALHKEKGKFCPSCMLKNQK